jgi:hypothetical protein
MPLTPVSRAHLQGLKARCDEKERLAKIENIVQIVYTTTVEMAERSEVTASHSLLPRESASRITGIETYKTVLVKFYEDNMKEILSRLRRLFPDSKVEHTVLWGPRRLKMSCLNEQDQHYLNEWDIDDYIVIDWSDL